MDKISIKAINPDNDKELRALARLFKNVYPNGCPSKDLHNSDFWKHHLGNSFIGLAAYHGESIIGHVGLTKSKTFKGGIELILPAFNVASMEDMYKVAECGRETIEGLATRQGWSSLSCVPLSENTDYLPILSKTMGFNECAIFPNSIAADALWYRYLNPAGTESSHDIYLPEHLEDIVGKVLNELAIPQRNIIQSSRNEVRPNVVALCRCRLGTSKIRVRLVANLTEHSDQDYQLIDSEVESVAVNISEEGADLAVNALAERGFQFCGYLPNYCGQDNLVLTRPVEVKNLPSQRLSAAGQLIAESLTYGPSSGSDHQILPNHSFPYAANGDIVTEEQGMI